MRDETYMKLQEMYKQVEEAESRWDEILNSILNWTYAVWLAIPFVVFVLYVTAYLMGY